MRHKTALLITLLLPLLGICQQTPVTGSVIKDFGKTYQVENPQFVTDTTSAFKAVFDVGRTFKDSTQINPLLNTAARFLNMHVAAGVSQNKINAALVIHGSAAYDILNDTKYKAKYGISNPNTSLITALTNQGVQIIICGQTAAYRNITNKDTHPKVQFALSAMTALIQLQNQNYRLINF